MKRIAIGLLLLSVSFSSFGQQKKWTLKECVTYALENNISVQQSELNLEASDIDRLDALGNFLPSLNGNMNVSENTGLSLNPTTNQLENTTFLSASASANIGYTVFDGLRNFRQVERAKMAKLAAQYNLNKMKDDISLFVANGFLQVLLNKANLDVIKAQNAVTKEQITLTQQQVEGGVLPRGDLLEIQATDANEMQRIAVAENQVTISLISLAQLMQIQDYANFDVVDETYDIVNAAISEKPVDEIVAAAKDNRSEVKIAIENLNLSKKDLQISRGAYYPTINAFFGYNTRFAESTVPGAPDFEEQLYLNDGIGYGFQMNVPIFNGFATRNNVKRSKINVWRNELNLKQAELDLESNVYQAYVDAEGSKKSYEAALSALESQQLAYQYAKDRYDVGFTNAFDFSQSKLRFDNAQIEVNRAKYDYIFKIKVLELYFGVPATELKF